MKVIHKNLSETFRLLLSLGDGYDGENFTIVFTSGDILTKTYTCSKVDNVYTNCEYVDDTHILCTLDNHGLPCGFLKVSITIEFEDSKLEDGTYTVGDKRLVEALDESGNPFHIELTGGTSDPYQTSEAQWNLIGTVLHGEDGLTTKIKVNGTTYEQVDGLIDLGDIGGGSGTSDYTKLSNKPKIGGTELDGDKSLDDLNIQEKVDDLGTIRSGASAGATAVQPEAISDMETGAHAAETYQPKESGKVLSSNDYTDADKAKLAKIPEDAEANVQPNWNQSDSTKDDYIQNKPDIPSTAAEISTTAGISEDKTVQSDLTQLAQNIGDLTSLETSAKTDLVVALNEVYDKLDEVYQDYIDADTLIG